MDSKTIRARLSQYFAHTKYPIQFAYLFGSHARGQALPFSDIDVGVYLDEPDHQARLAMYRPLLGELIDLLDTTEVELAYLNDADPVLAYNILTGERLYASDELARSRVEGGLLSEFFDAVESEEQYFRLFEERVLAGKMSIRSPEMIDKITTQRRLDYIKDAVTELKTYGAQSFEEFKKDRRTYNAAAYQVQTAIEAVMDIANHLIAALGLERPRERGDVVLILAQEKILPEDLAKRLRTAIGLRNRLVHGYIDLLLESLYQAIRDDLGDLEGFSRHIVEFLRSQGSSGQHSATNG